MQQFKLGSRESSLALVQAKFVQDLLNNIGTTTEINCYKSDGDINLVQPLYEMGVQGIFTKTLDAALLNHKIDIAVHSLKDVPTQLPKGIAICAVPTRAKPFDVLLSSHETTLDDHEKTIATSSLRRKSQWLHKYPNHKTENIRGNVQSRIRKLEENVNWSGAIFAQAGLERLNISYTNTIVLDWMIPAPAQGAIVVMCREEDKILLEIGQQLTDANTLHCVNAERQFLRTLHGGCSVPIGCYAKIENNYMHIEGCILTKDGKEKLSATLIFNTHEYAIAGKILAEYILAQGALKIIETFKKA